MRRPVAVVRGGGDLATGTINRLFKSGFIVYVLEMARPTVIRLNVSAASALFDGSIEVEGLLYFRADSIEDARQLISQGKVPVLVDPKMKYLSEIKPDLLVDATLAKINMGVTKELAPCVIGLGPGFTAGFDCHAVVETSRGHDLGVLIYDGRAHENTGIPGLIAGFAEERVIRSTGDGVLERKVEIGDLVKQGDIIGHVAGVPVYARIDGVIRGLIHPDVSVHEGMKIGDIDPRGNVRACFTISDKARALGGSVLEGFLHLTGGVQID